MAEQQKQSLCPRLIDYLAIVGARSGTVQRTAGSNNNQPPVQVSEIFNHFSRVLADREIFLVLTLMRTKFGGASR